MIRYALACLNGHRFETWFANGDAYDDLVRQRLVACPTCGAADVAKTVMAPAVVTRGGAKTDTATIDAARFKGENSGAENSGAAGAEGSAAPASSPMLRDERAVAMRAMLRGLRERVLSEGEDVGARFPDEARRIHDGVTPARPIHGRATPDEARALIEDGVPILPVPMLPEERN